MHVCVSTGCDLTLAQHEADLLTDPEAMGMETVPTFLDPVISHPDAPNHETCWACYAMSEQCVAGCVWVVGPGCP